MRHARLGAIALLSLSAIAIGAASAAPLPLAAVAPPAPIAVSASVSVTPSVGISEDAYVPKGEVHQGDLVSIMGDVRVDGEVTGTVVVVMGSLDMNGRARGDVVSVMTKTHLGEAAQVDGQFVNVGWSPERDHGSRVEGEVVNINFMNLVPFAGHGGGIRGLIRFLLILHLIKLTFLFVIILVIAALVPRRLSAMAGEFPVRWGWSFLVGLLTYAGVFIGVFVLAATIIGIPLAIVLWMVAKMLKWCGLAAIFYLMGQSIGRNMFRRELPHVASVLCGFVIYAFLSFIPGLGWVFGKVLSIMALGLVLVTRFGAEPAPAGASTRPVAPPPFPGSPMAADPAPAAGSPAGAGAGAEPPRVW